MAHARRSRGGTAGGTGSAAHLLSSSGVALLVLGFVVAPSISGRATAQTQTITIADTVDDAYETGAGTRSYNGLTYVPVSENSPATNASYTGGGFRFPWAQRPQPGHDHERDASAVRHQRDLRRHRRHHLRPRHRERAGLRRRAEHPFHGRTPEDEQRADRLSGSHGRRVPGLRRHRDRAGDRGPPGLERRAGGGLHRGAPRVLLLRLPEGDAIQRLELRREPRPARPRLCLVRRPPGRSPLRPAPGPDRLRGDFLRRPAPLPLPAERTRRAPRSR